MARERGLYRRKDSPYWWIDVVLPGGQRICRSTRIKDTNDATEFLINLKVAAYKFLRDGVSQEHMWREAVVRYVAENSAKRTLQADIDNLKKLDPFLGHLNLKHVNMDAIWPFIHLRQTEHRVANATINRALEVVRRILHLARDEWNWVERFSKLRMLKEPRRRIRFLAREEADHLLEELPKHLRPLVQFALSTGCRMGEIVNLEWRRVDLDRRVAWLDHGTTKNGDGRGIPLNKDAVLALRGCVGNSRQWCFTYGGKRMDRVGTAWKRALKRAGITEFRFHDLRHTWASWHVMNGTSLQELMELGGWKSYEMVLRYAHLAPEHLSTAASRIERKMEVVELNPTITLR